MEWVEYGRELRGGEWKNEMKSEIEEYQHLEASKGKKELEKTMPERKQNQEKW